MHRQTLNFVLLRAESQSTKPIKYSEWLSERTFFNLSTPISLCPPKHPLLSCWPRQTQLLAHLSNVCFGKWNLIYFYFPKRNLIKRKSENNSRNLCHLSSWMEVECWGEIFTDGKFTCQFSLSQFFPHFHVIKRKRASLRKEIYVTLVTLMSMWCYKLNFSANLFP